MRYGGNTSCVSMRSGDQPPIVFDLGTGLRYFGASWPSDRPFDGTALLTHLHWDHVQGLPFFVPLLRDGAQPRRVRARCRRTDAASTRPSTRSSARPTSR